MHRPGVLLACLLAAVAVGVSLPQPAQAGAKARAAKAERVLAKSLRKSGTQIRTANCRARSSRRWRCRWRSSTHGRACTGVSDVLRRGKRWRVRRRSVRCTSAGAIGAPATPARPQLPEAGPSAPAPQPTSPTPHFGFSETPDGRLPLDRHAELAVNAGADSQRLTLGWNWAEPNRDDYRLGGFDQLYNTAVARGIRPLITVLFSPSWTWAPGTECSGPECTYPPDPRFDAEWREFCALVARRYPKALAFEIWNEPNLRVFWKPLPDVERYSQLLSQAYGAIKAVRPSAEVISGGFADPSDTSAGDISLSDFTRGVYERGGKAYMDGIGFHPYGAVLGTEIVQRAFSRVREVRDSFGDESKPLWATEFGLTTTGSPWPRVWTEEEQAIGLTAHYGAMAAMRDVKGVFVHTLLEEQSSREGMGSGYGVVRGDGSPKPAYCALAAARGRSATCE